LVRKLDAKPGGCGTLVVWLQSGPEGKAHMKTRPAEPPWTRSGQVAAIEGNEQRLTVLREHDRRQAQRDKIWHAVRAALDAAPDDVRLPDLRHGRRS
jgi:tRNA(Arg) A34 adenosine deaminase TadA